MKKVIKTTKYSMAEILSVTAFAHRGGGGNPLIAWVLGCFGIVNSCVDWFLGCFDIAKGFALCVLGCFDKFIRYPEPVSGFCAIDIKFEVLLHKGKGVLVKAITPHLILQKNKFFAKSSSPSRGEESHAKIFFTFQHKDF